MVPLIITILLCFISGVFVRLYLTGKPSFHIKNQWWKYYVAKMMALWGRLLIYTLIAGLLFGWIDAIINLPPDNPFSILLQTLATVFSGLAITIFQSYFVGFGFLLNPFRENQEMIDGRIIEAAQKRILQISIWIIFSILLLSILVDWINKLI